MVRAAESFPRREICIVKQLIFAFECGILKKRFKHIIYIDQ